MFEGEIKFSKVGAICKIGFELCVYAILFFVPLAFCTQFFLSFELPKVFLFRGFLYLGTVFLLMRILIERRVKVVEIFKSRAFLWLLTAVVGVLVISTLFAIEPNVSFWGSYFRQQGLFSYLHYLLFFVVLLLGFEKREFKRALIVSGVSFFIALVYGVMQKFGWYIGDFEINTFLGRVFSTFGHPNYFSSFVLICFFPVCASVYLAFKKKKWFAFGFSLALFVLSILNFYFTKGRASILGVFVGATVFLILLMILIGRKRLIALALIPVVVLVSAVFVSNVFKIPGRLLLEGENLRSIETRLIMWPSVFDTTLDRPFFGYGPDTFAQGYAPNMQKELMSVENFQDIPDRAHNIILQWLFDYGFVGLFVIMAMIGWISVFVVRIIKKAEFGSGIFIIGIFSSIVGLFISHQFGFSSTEHLVFLAFLFACMFEFLNESVTYKNFRFGRILALLCIPVIALFGLNLRFAYADILFFDAYEGFSSQEFYESMKTAIRADNLNPFQNYYKHTIGSTYLSLSKAVVNDPSFKDGVLNQALNYSSQVDKFSSGNDGLGQMLIGLVYAEKGDTVSAESVFGVAKTLMPKYPNLYLEIGKFYFNNGRMKEAVDTLEYYLSLSPKDWQDKNNFDKYRLFYKANPTFNEVFWYLKEAGKALGNKEKATKYEEYVK